MRVLHLLAPAPFGGLERVVEGLASVQAGAGLEVGVALIVEVPEPPPQLLARLKGRGVEVRVLVVPPRAYRKERQAVRALLETQRPDVLHTHGYRPDVLDAPVARRVGVPPVTTVHGFTGGGWKNRFYERQQVRAFRRFPAVVAVSERLAQDLRARGVPRDRVHVVRNAWVPLPDPLSPSEARAALGLHSPGPYIGWIGRFTPEKDPELMLRGFASLSVREARLVMVGSGPLEASLRRLAAGLGIADRVVWAGFVPDAERILSAFDLLALTSRTEGTPMVLLEAMGLGVPIVTRSVGGVPEFLSPSEAGIVEDEAPETLAREVEGALTDRAAAMHRAEAARSRLRREFDPESWSLAYLRIYRSVST